MKPGENLSDQKRRFCIELVSGKSQTQAAIAAGYSKRSAGNQASRLCTDDEVLEYCDFLRKEAESDRVASLQEILEFCSEAMRTPVGSVDETHKLAQEVEVSDKRTKVKMVSKLDAIDRLCRIKGHYAKDKVEHSISPESQEFMEWFSSQRKKAKLIE